MLSSAQRMAKSMSYSAIAMLFMKAKYPDKDIKIMQIISQPTETIMQPPLLCCINILSVAVRQYPRTL